MAVIRIVPAGANVIGSGQVDDGAGTPVTEAIVRAFDNKAYPNTSSKIDITNVRRPDTSSGLSVYGWEVDTTANFTVDMKFSWVAGTYILGIILCGDTERDAYLAYTLTNVFNTVDPTHPVQSWVLASQPDGVANGNGPGALPGDGLLVTGDIVKLRLSGTGHATNPVLTFSMRREQADTTLIYDYTNLTGLTAVNLKDWYTLWSLATDGCRVGIFADGGFGVNASIPITEFKVTATKRTPAALPSTPIHYGVIGDSITTMLPATANTRQKLVVPAAMDLALVSLTNYNGHENLKGNGRSFATSADIINSATYVGLNSSALEIAIIMIGTNDGNQATPVTKAAYKANVTALAAQINTACKILFVRPAKVDTADKVVANAAFIEYGAALDEITASLNATTPGRCYQVSLLALDPTLIADDVHWTKNTTLQPQGAAIIANGIVTLLAGVNSVTINQGATASVTGEATLQLTATLDPVDSPAPIAWSIVSGTGTINPSSGLFQAPGAGVSAKVTVVRATAGGQHDDITITTPPAGAGGTGVWTMGAPIKVVSAPVRLTAAAQSLAAYSRFVVAVAGTLHATGNDASTISEVVAVGDTWFGLASLTTGNTAVFDAYKITVGV